MSSPAISKSYLGPSDLAMLDRVLARANSTDATGAHSFEHRRIARLLIRKFQGGMTREDELLQEIKPTAVAYQELGSTSVQ